MKYITLLSLSLVILSACTWVNENPVGQEVSIVLNKYVSNCQKKGKISVQVKDKIAFYNRGSEKVLTELQTLARNEAVKLGANTIVANEAPKDGRQTYSAYYCP